VKAFEIAGKIVDSPKDNDMNMGRFVRVTAKTKQTKLTILRLGLVTGEIHLHAKESVIISKAASQSITCPDSYCTRIRYASE
tara:strand:+ start:172 stop:417 length:246 start_codon:yes stop_codon:yes gene_type:complete